jgi:hypothetical protein
MLNYAEKLQFSLGCLARDSFDLSAIEVVWVFWDPPVPAQQAQLQVACANLRDVKVVGYRLLRLEQGCHRGPDESFMDVIDNHRGIPSDFRMRIY